MFSYLRDWLRDRPNLHSQVSEMGLPFLLEPDVSPSASGSSLRHHSLAQQEGRLGRLAALVAPQFVCESRDFHVRDDGDFIFLRHLLAAISGPLHVHADDLPSGRGADAAGLSGDVGDMLATLVSAVRGGATLGSPRGGLTGYWVG